MTIANTYSNKKHKKSHIILKVCLILPLLVVLSFLLPVKLVRASTEKIRTKPFYIIDFISEGSTEGGMCRLYQNQNGEWEVVSYITLTGNDPRKEITSSIYNSYTKFIVYGTLTQIPDDSQTSAYVLDSVLNVEDWDILQEVKGGLHKHYLTIYDWKWAEPAY